MSWPKAAASPGGPAVPQVEAERGLVVETADGGFCGAVVGCEKLGVTLEDRRGRQRIFPLDRAAFLLEGKPVTLVRPAAAAPPPRPARTASGSVAPPQAAVARVARASRIYVEGRHDAELVEQIWGDDLRDVGVVVEYLAGVDHLPPIVTRVRARPGTPPRRPGRPPGHGLEGEPHRGRRSASDHVLITGHPFVDIWQAVKPAAVGIAAWPQVPRGVPWKEGVVRALGWPLDTAAAWQRIRRAARSFTDLEPALLGSVEHLIDFVTGPDAC